MSSKSSVRNAYIVMIAGGIAVLALVGWALNRSFEAPVASQIPPIPQTTTTQVVADEHVQTPEKAAVPRITVEQLKEQIKNGAVTVIDVRDRDSYQMGHIPGSLHIPLASIQAQIPYLPKAKPMVTYCT
ncbi:MAG TPA: rhodanese-like domain-containing protein [Thermoanaerobaculia bacterium]